MQVATFQLVVAVRLVLYLQQHVAGRRTGAFIALATQPDDLSGQDARWNFHAEIAPLSSAIHVAPVKVNLTRATGMRLFYRQRQHDPYVAPTRPRLPRLSGAPSEQLAEILATAKAAGATTSAAE